MKDTWDGEPIPKIRIEYLPLGGTPDVASTSSLIEQDLFMHSTQYNGG